MSNFSCKIKEIVLPEVSYEALLSLVFVASVRLHLSKSAIDLIISDALRNFLYEMLKS